MTVIKVMRMIIIALIIMMIVTMKDDDTKIRFKRVDSDEITTVKKKFEAEVSCVSLSPERISREAGS